MPSLARKIVKPPPREVELKLNFAPAARAAIDAHPALAPPPKTQQLAAIYYDTPDLALGAAGFTLRVRKSGRRFVQTLKSETDHSGVAASRAEWEWPVAGETPELAPLAETPVGAALTLERLAQLGPIFTTRVTRTTRRLRLGRTLVELALDEGVVRCGEAETPLHEMELELKSGAPGPLYQLALELAADLQLRLGTDTKAARGMRLRTGGKPAVIKAGEPALEAGVRIAGAFRRIIGAGLAGLLGNQAAAEAGDAEGIHQMRVAIRRLRAALQLFAPHLELRAATGFNNRLRALSHVLGEARDWDVFCLQTLPALNADHLREPAASRRAAAHAQLVNALAAPEPTALMLGLTAWAEDAAAGDATLSEVAPALLDRLAAKVGKRGKHIARRSAEDLHDLRKALKKLRYGADYLAGLYPKKAVKTYLKPVKQLQELLGDGNDAAMAATLAVTLGEAELASAGEARRGKALRRLPTAWHKYKDAAPFWR